MPSLAVATVVITVLAAFGQVLLPLGVVLSLVGYTVATATPRPYSIFALVAAEAVLCLGLWIGIAFGHGAARSRCGRGDPELPSTRGGMVRR